MFTVMLVPTVLFLSTALPAAAAAEATVRMGNTTITGRVIAASGTVEYLGIPYATAARFGVPVDTEALPSGAFDATGFGPCCPQVPAVYAPNQAEACNNLNVFAPSAIDAPDGGGAPVLFFIHGGGGTTGCSAQSLPPLYNGTTLIARAKEPVVVVTINYRLSVLANLYLEGGIKDGLQARDQMSALRWVQKHIAKFGGDPGRVLIFGESGGGNAVSQLSITPGSDGLFHHFISESGTYPLATGFQTISAADAAGRSLAAGLNCTAADAADIVACLRKLPTMTVQNSAGMAQLGVVVGAELTPVYPFRVGTNISSTLKTATAGWNQPDLFVICGQSGSATRNLGASAAEGYLAQNIPLWTGATSAQVAAAIAAYNVSSCTPEGGGGPLCCTVTESVMLDATMRCPAHRTLKAHAARKPGSAYAYELNCCPTCPRPAGGTECICQHTSELQYVFGSTSNYQSDTPNQTCALEPQFRPFSDGVIDRWTGIAANGSHNGDMGGAVWPSFGDGKTLFYLNEGDGNSGPITFGPAAWELSNCDLWAQIDEAVATKKFGPPGPGGTTTTETPGNENRTHENRNLWKELMPLWATLLVVSLIVLFFSVRYFVKKKNEADRTKSTANPVIAFQDLHKRAVEISSN